MGLGPHAGFIIASFAVVITVVALLVAWVTIDHVAQKRALAELERRGVSRRSAEPRPSKLKEQAR